MRVLFTATNMIMFFFGLLFYSRKIGNVFALLVTARKADHVFSGHFFESIKNINDCMNCFFSLRSKTQGHLRPIFLSQASRNEF